MPVLIALLFGAVAGTETCASHDSEDNVCLLALNSSRTRLEAVANATAAGLSELNNTINGSAQKGLGTTLGTTLGTLVSDYRERNARSGAAGAAGDAGSAKEASAGGDAASSQSSDSGSGSTDHATDGLTAAATAAAVAKYKQISKQEPHSEGISLEPNLHSGLTSQPSSAYDLNTQNASKRTLNPAPESSGKYHDEIGKGPYEGSSTSYADELHAKFGTQISGGFETQSAQMSSGATELQTVLKTMYNLGRLIKRMPDDKLETQRETPAPTPPPYAFARRFEPFGKGTSTIGT